MEINEFKRVFKRDINFFNVTDDVILFNNPLHVWDARTEETFKYKNLDDALEHVVDGKKIIEYVNEWDGSLKLHGSGGSGSKSGKKFNPFDGAGKPSHTVDLLPASMNTATFRKSPIRSDEDAIKAFSNRHRNSPVEYTTTVDKMGYASHYGVGQKGSVIPRNITKGSTVIHNHPKQGDGKDYNNFSGQDIKFLAGSKANRLIAVGQQGDYSITKGAKFKGNDLVKALKRGVHGKTYDGAMGDFLEKNQKKYGYSYSFTPKSTKQSTKTAKITSKKVTKPKKVEQIAFDF